MQTTENHRRGKVTAIYDHNGITRNYDSTPENIIIKHRYVNTNFDIKKFQLVIRTESDADFSFVINRTKGETLENAHEHLTSFMKLVEVKQ